MLPPEKGSSDAQRSNPSSLPSVLRADDTSLARVGPLKGYVDIEKRTYKCPKGGEEQDWVVKEL